MCLAVPAQLKSRTRDEGLVDLRGTSVRISTVLVPDARPGDWVLVHAGFAIERLDPEQAKETFSVLREIDRASAATPAGEDLP